MDRENQDTDWASVPFATTKRTQATYCPDSLEGIDGRDRVVDRLWKILCARLVWGPWVL